MTEVATSYMAVDAAFGAFRAAYPAKGPMKAADNDDQLRLIVTGDLARLRDGSGSEAPGHPPEISRDPEGIRLWVVRPEDVVHAAETCDFATGCSDGVIKHTNLTGGTPAHCGGEMLVYDETTLVVNGGSGRYGPTSEAEMMAVAKAFRDSGYGVWYYAYDDESGEAFRFGSRSPEWLA